MFEDIKNVIEIVGNFKFIQRVIFLVGIEFGIKIDFMFKSINIINKDYNCSIFIMKGSK